MSNLRKDNLQVPESIWAKPVTDPITVTDFMEQEHLVVECTDGHFRYVKGTKILTDKVWCKHHRDSHPVDLDETGKVVKVHVPQSC